MRQEIQQRCIGLARHILDTGDTVRQTAKRFGHTIQQRSELDWLIYNAPLEYAQLVLNGRIEEYIRLATEL